MLFLIAKIINKQQTNNFNMFTVVELHFNNNPTLWHTSAPSVYAKEMLSTNIAEI